MLLTRWCARRMRQRIGGAPDGQHDHFLLFWKVEYLDAVRSVEHARPARRLAARCCGPPPERYLTLDVQVARPWLEREW